MLPCFCSRRAHQRHVGVPAQAAPLLLPAALGPLQAVPRLPAGRPHPGLLAAAAFFPGPADAGAPGPGAPELSPDLKPPLTPDQPGAHASHV